jgi:prophage antirepressor-like protein
MRTENWCGHNIRFVEIDGEWYAILKDICDALELKVKHVSERIPSETMERVLVDMSKVGLTGVRYEHKPVKDISRIQLGQELARKPGDNKTRWMLAVNELGIYEALFASRKLEARKFRMWVGTVLQKLRKSVGLQGYEVMRMTEPEIQDEIDHMLDILFWDEETKRLMVSVTVQGGDVEQVPFDEWNLPGCDT